MLAKYMLAVFIVSNSALGNSNQKEKMAWNGLMRRSQQVKKCSELVAIT